MATTNVQSRCYIFAVVYELWCLDTTHKGRGCVGLASEFESEHTITKKVLQRELNLKAIMKLLFCMCCVLQGFSWKSLYAHIALVVLKLAIHFWEQDSQSHHKTSEHHWTANPRFFFPWPIILWCGHWNALSSLIWSICTIFSPLSVLSLFVETLVTLHIAFQREGISTTELQQ